MVTPYQQPLRKVTTIEEVERTNHGIYHAATIASDSALLRNAIRRDREK
jgi:hypothetical protein